ncbi:hypothetical protein KJ877_01960 [bacterium]|nr:hypothetical protein [bacterium]MBU1989367.1 hypothetical protein [bacterium]
MLHPAAAHFAVALPIISLVLGLAYILKPTELMSKISTRFMVFTTIFIAVAFFTGKEDGGEVFILLSTAGQELLKEHKNLGLYIFVGVGFVTLIKLFGCFTKNFKAEVLSVILIAVVAGGVLYQGKIGGELTYTHGAHVQDHSDGMDCLEDPAEFLEE